MGCLQCARHITFIHICMFPFDLSLRSAPLTVPLTEETKAQSEVVRSQVTPELQKG